MTLMERENKTNAIENEAIELNKKIKYRLIELGLTEFHFGDFYGNGECVWCDEEIDLGICINEIYYEFQYWSVNMPIRYEEICIDLRAVKIVGDTILYCLEWYSYTDKGSNNEEAYFVEFEELLDMDYANNYKNIHSLLNNVLDSLSDDDDYRLIKTNKEYFGKQKRTLAVGF